MPTQMETGRDIVRQTREEVSRLDRRHKLGLLVVGLLTLVLLVAAALREHVFVPWRQIQLQYGEILAKKATDDRGRKLAEGFEVKIKQNVVPGLGVMDRCVSCHNGIQDPRMKDVHQPHRVHPGKLLTWHDPSKLGCSICHRGQGRALDFPAVKGHGHHWDYPLLPSRYTQSSCGLCHSPNSIKNKGGEKLARGEALFTSKGCYSCHKIGGRGGSLGPALDDVGGKVAPQLPMARIKGPHTLPQWLSEHFEDPQRVVPGSQMKPPRLSRQENEALTTYMLSLRERPIPSTHLTASKHLEIYKRANPAAMTGGQLYARYCASCHDTGTYGLYDGFFNKFIPAVRGATFVQQAAPAYVEASIRDGRPGTLMPSWGAQGGGLDSGEIRRLRQYLLSSAPARGAVQAAGAEASGRGNAGSGGRLFRKHCAACHGQSGEGAQGPSLRNRVFQKSASDAFILATVSQGRRDTAMPAFSSSDGEALSTSQLHDLLAHIRALAKGTPQAQMKKERRP